MPGLVLLGLLMCPAQLPHLAASDPIALDSPANKSKLLAAQRPQPCRDTCDMANVRWKGCCVAWGNAGRQHLADASLRTIKKQQHALRQQKTA